MKKIFCFLILIVSIFCSVSVLAQNPYGFSDEFMDFFEKYNIDVGIFAEVFNGEENDSTLESLESDLWSIKAQTQAYDFNEEQVKALINNEIKRILNYRKVEYATIPKCKVTFNGQEVISTSRRYPILQFRDITYFPMTYDDCRFLGVTTHWDADAYKLTITKEPVENARYNAYESLQNPDKFVCEGVEGIYGEVRYYKFDIEVNGKEIVNSEEEYPLLLFRNITYFPLTWRFAVNEFGWEYNYDDYNGLSINSVE